MRFGDDTMPVGVGVVCERDIEMIAHADQTAHGML